MKITKKIICLLLILMLPLSIIPAEAATITFRWTITISSRLRIRNGGRSDTKVRLSDKTDKIEVGEESYIALWNANNSVKWSVSKKGIIRIKKDGNGVGYIGLKPGKCYLKAKYKGKTYKCKVTVKKLANNVYFTHKPYCTVNTGAVTMFCKYPCNVSYIIENPSIASVSVYKEPYSMEPSMDSEYKIWVDALRPGNTRIFILNSYNPAEIQYIYVTVKEISEENRSYDIDLQHIINGR